MIVSPLRERLRAALLLAALGAGLGEGAARTAPEQTQASEAVPVAAAPVAQSLKGAVCEARLDSLEHLQAEGRVEWVTWD
ncbi:MAG TPA: hypothetical protein VK465_01425, partial [Fibrobacteria bacterium]|nr:hypothetical protein [Fibrobacteria bacterium]